MRADGADIFFGSLKGPRPQIYTATGSGTNCAAPTGFNQAAASSAEDAPILSRDGKALFFGSVRPGTAGTLDTWVARRPTASGPFTAPVHLAELATSEAEYPSWVSPDECLIYFSRGVVGARDIHRARRPK